MLPAMVAGIVDDSAAKSMDHVVRPLVDGVADDCNAAAKIPPFIAQNIHVVRKPDNSNLAVVVPPRSNLVTPTVQRLWHNPGTPE
jgi:hypothetical protein